MISFELFRFAHRDAVQDQLHELSRLEQNERPHALWQRAGARVDSPCWQNIGFNSDGDHTL